MLVPGALPILFLCWVEGERGGLSRRRAMIPINMMKAGLGREAKLVTHNKR